MKIANKTKFAIGTFLIAGLTVDCAGNTPFSQDDLASGYKNDAKATAQHSMDKMKSGTCGEGKCGSQVTEKTKAVEADAKKAMEGKCGEGKCGGSK
jgi:uncharacterized low-complexity protein